MKKIPYNLYIHFEALDFFLKGDNNHKEDLLRCGLTSIELSAYLLGSLFTDNNINLNKVEHLLRGIKTQFKLLNTCDFSVEGKAFQSGRSKNLEHLKLLDSSYRNDIERISTLYFDLTKKINIGLDVQMNEIRSHFNLPEITIGSNNDTKEIEYPNILEVLKLDDLEYFNSEDKTFMVVHQISECWFYLAINELKAIQNIFYDIDENSEAIMHHFKANYEIFLYLADHILLLDHMVLSDYHPLRVVLRGASGGQSQQAYEMFGIAIQLFKTFLHTIKNEDKSIVHILENPKTNPNYVALINQFTNLERSLKNFFFQHYVLTSNIIGSQSFGSIGYDLVSLVDKFVEPIFKEIDDAKYDLTLKTNFQYGSIAGQLIMEKEDFTPQDKEEHTSNQDTINAVIDSYFELISALDQEKWVELFTENGYIEDPVGSRPYVGHQQLAIFFKGVIRFFKALNMSVVSKTFEKDSIKVYWKSESTAYNDKKIAYEGVEEFRISSDGKIMAALVHWDPAVISNQL
ncbi:tryptophan 2,3-dioxygenase family protein [Brumimicrobium aurantiacum]|uniref:SnoaL-like domain-containing protein n=1 Tax=Brumimicrobium aurantiacum TaxID=1737063 RepID=A0A3E1F238_9FLAO|nr:tryptophan 2,3-dioxygenase family protein [Brumimicrobium aurantiacum]RFC55886.1 hypothetical protein DXU93_02815 [Brumimicrobium aurantiacum]